MPVKVKESKEEEVQMSQKDVEVQAATPIPNTTEEVEELDIPGVGKIKLRRPKTRDMIRLEKIAGKNSVKFAGQFSAPEERQAALSTTLNIEPAVDMIAILSDNDTEEFRNLLLEAELEDLYPIFEQMDKVINFRKFGIS